jgi:hypothetical protein
MCIRVCVCTQGMYYMFVFIHVNACARCLSGLCVVTYVCMRASSVSVSCISVCIICVSVRNMYVCMRMYAGMNMYVHACMYHGTHVCMYASPVSMYHLYVRIVPLFAFINVQVYAGE